MIGRTIGRYRIEKELGQGVMGSVWEAFDERLKRSVALKLIPESLAVDPITRDRFLREARAASALNHPGIAAVYDAGEADGSVYIAFQKIEGENLAARVASGPLPVREAVTIARQCAEALDHAHNQGILHRDITSHNIMVTPSGQAVLVDFGLARLGDGSTLTRPDTTLETAGYLAPEVWKGEPASVRSDLYALGVILYEMVTGVRPFIADRPESLVYSVLNEDPLPPGENRAGLPPELEKLILKTMARDPVYRFQTAADLARELEVLEVKGWTGTGIGGAAAPPRTPRTPRPLPFGARRYTKWPRILIRHGRRGSEPAWERILLMAAVMTAAGFGIWKLTDSSRLGRPRFNSVAVLPFRNLGDETGGNQYLVDGMGRMLVTRLAELNEIRVTPWETSLRFGEDGLDLRETARRLNVDVLLTGSIRQGRGLIQGTISVTDARKNRVLWADEFQERGEDVFEVQKTIARRTAEALKGKLSNTEKRRLMEPPARDLVAWRTYLKASSELMSGDRDGTDRAALLFQSALAGDSTLAEAWVGLGAVYSTRWFFGWNRGPDVLKDAESCFRRALDLNADSPEALRGLSSIYWYQDRSEDCLRIGWETSHKARLTTDDLLVIAGAYMRGGLVNHALSGFHQVIQNDPENVPAHFFLIPVYAWLGRFPECIAAAQDYIERFGDDPDPYFWLGIAHLYLGHLEEARHYMEVCYQLLPEREDGLFLGYILRRNGDEAGAMTLWKKALEKSERDVAAFPGDFRSRVSLIGACAFLGDSTRLNEELALYEEMAMDLRQGRSTGDLVWLLALAGHSDLAIKLSSMGVVLGLNECDQTQSLLAPLVPPNHRQKLNELLSDATRFHHRLETRYAPMVRP